MPDDQNRRNDSVVLVFTSRSVEQMLNDGGSRSWVLDARRARGCNFVACAWNSTGEFAEGAQDRAHGAVFFVGRISAVEPVPGTTRFMLRVSEYATANIPGAWGHQRNPVMYTTLRELNIDPDDLTFRPMPAPTREPEPVWQPLTIEAAKRGLSAKFDVPVESIEILIRV
jgi:hypothetical protein